MFDNTYSIITEPVDAFLLVGHTPGNTYVGSSRAYDPIFQAITLQVDDQVHEIPGGRFLIRDGVSLGELRWQLEDKHLFERGATPQRPPQHALRPHSQPSQPANGYRVEQVRPDQAWVRSHAQPFGRGPVWVLNPAGEDGKPQLSGS